MRTKRNQRGVRRARVPLTVVLRTAVSRHVRNRLVLYVPALVPLLLFLVAHLLALLILICIKSGVLHQGQSIHKTAVTWAFYGFLPLLLSSYCCFFAVARPVAGQLPHKFPDWTAPMHTLAAGAAYGAAMGMLLLLLLEPRTLLNAAFLLLVGIATGLGNWFFYRKLTIVDA